MFTVPFPPPPPRCVAGHSCGEWKPVGPCGDHDLPQVLPLPCCAEAHRDRQRSVAEERSGHGHRRVDQHAAGHAGHVLPRGLRVPGPGGPGLPPRALGYVMSVGAEWGKQHVGLLALERTC